MVTEGAAVRTRGNTTFSNNFAYNDGGVHFSLSLLLSL